MAKDVSKVNLKKDPLTRLPQAAQEVERVEIRDSLDEVFGQMSKREAVSPLKIERDKQRRIRGAIAYRFISDKIRVRDTIANWDKIMDDPGEAEARGQLEQIAGVKLTTRDAFFRNLRYRLHGAIRTQAASGEWRRLWVGDTHPVMREFDTTVAEANRLVEQDSKVKIEETHQVEMLPTPRDIRMGNSWVFDLNVSAPSKGHRLSDSEKAAEKERLVRLRGKFEKEIEGLRANFPKLIHQRAMQLKNDPRKGMSHHGLDELENIAERRLSERRELLARLVDDSEYGILKRAIELVDDERCPAMWALQEAKNRIGSDMRARNADNPLFAANFMADQSKDYEQAGEYAMLALSGKTPKQLARLALQNMKHGTIVFCKTAPDMDAMEMFAESEKVVGLVVGERQGIGRHRGEIFKERSKMIAYLKDFDERDIQQGYHVIMDNFTKDAPRIVRNPTCSMLEHYNEEMEKLGVARKRNYLEAGLHARTRRRGGDRRGPVIQLAANISSEREVRHAVDMGAKGCGLSRSEELLFALERLGSMEDLEEYLYINYYQQAKEFEKSRTPSKKGYAINIRAFDLGGDKVSGCVRHLFGQGDRSPENFRGLQVLRANPELFRAQIRAMLRLSDVIPELEFTVPMVETKEDVEFIRQQIEAAKSELDERGKGYSKDFRWGVMVETEKGVKNLGKILATGVRKVSVGHNDLTCDIMKIPQEEFVSGVDDFDPKVLKAAKSVADNMGLEGVADSENDRFYPLANCGNIAGTVDGALILVGLGYRKLSMSADEMPGIRRALRDCNIEDLETAANEAIGFGDGRQVREHFKKRMRELGGVNLDKRDYYS